MADLLFINFGPLTHHELSMHHNAGLDTSGVGRLYIYIYYVFCFCKPRPFKLSTTLSGAEPSGVRHPCPEQVPQTPTGPNQPTHPKQRTSRGKGGGRGEGKEEIRKTPSQGTALSHSARRISVITEQQKTSNPGNKLHTPVRV